MDIVSKIKRSQMMAGIRSKNTRPELQIRKALHARGFRFRIHVIDLPGKPDIVLPKFRAVIFVHGCFWHGHDCCLFKMPQTRADFWAEKVDKNRSNDDKATSALQEKGWRVIIVWECALRGKSKLEFAQLIDMLSCQIAGLDSDFLELRGL